MMFSHGQNWFAQRLFTTLQLIVANGAGDERIKNILADCHLELHMQTGASEADILGCLEQIQPEMARLKSNPNPPAQIAYSILYQVLYGRGTFH